MIAKCDGLVPYPVAGSLNSIATLMYLLSRRFSDGFGLTQLEAQAWKLPIMTTKFCGDVVMDGRNGWLLSDITASAISTTLRRCLAAPVHLQELSARCTVPGRFDLAHVGEQWIHVFD